MKLYSIRNWSEWFENNRSKTVKDLSWVAIPNRHDGEHFSAIMLHKHGAEIFSAWILIIQVASRCQPRGTLLRDGGKPHSPQSLSIKTRAPAIWFERGLEFLEEFTDWLEVKEFALGCQPPVSHLSASCQAGDEERMEGMEGKEGSEPDLVGGYHRDTRTVLHLLNEATGKRFREVDGNLTVISSRLKEPDVTLDGVKQMIARQCKLWKGDRMEEYLRPATLFGKEKFDGYYAARELPINENSKPNSPKLHVRPDRNAGSYNEGGHDDYERLVK